MMTEKPPIDGVFVYFHYTFSGIQFTLFVETLIFRLVFNMHTTIIIEC